MKLILKGEERLVLPSVRRREKKAEFLGLLNWKPPFMHELSPPSFASQLLSNGELARLRRWESPGRKDPTESRADIYLNP